MAIKVEHEIHRRRKGRNIGVGLLLAGLLVVIFGLTVVKVIELGKANSFAQAGISE